MYSNESVPHPFVFHRGSHIAGRSLEEALAAYRDHPYDPHMSPGEALEQMGGARWDRAVHFTFVRNPWSRVVSCWYRWHRDKMDFDAFVQNHIGGGKPPHRGVQLASYLQRGIGNLDYLDFVGKFENLHADFAAILDVLGLPAVRLGHHHANSRKRPYTDFYNDETRRIVGEYLRDDCEAFGYEYGEGVDR